MRRESERMLPKLMEKENVKAIAASYLFSAFPTFFEEEEDRNKGLKRIWGAIDRAARNSGTAQMIIQTVKHNFEKGAGFLKEGEHFEFGDYTVRPTVSFYDDAFWGYGLFKGKTALAHVGFDFTPQGARIENVQGNVNSEEELKKFSKLFRGRPWRHVLTAITMNYLARNGNIFGVRTEAHPIWKMLINEEKKRRTTQRKQKEEKTVTEQQNEGGKPPRRKLTIAEQKALIDNHYSRMWRELRFEEQDKHYYRATKETIEKIKRILGRLRTPQTKELKSDREC